MMYDIFGLTIMVVRSHTIFLQVFDISRKVTYANLKKWFQELRRICQSCPVICVANKIDLDKKVCNDTMHCIWSSDG